MTDRKNTRPRRVDVRRVSTLTGVVALTAAGAIATSDARAEGEASARTGVMETRAEGMVEAEGEAGPATVEEGEGDARADEGEGEGEAHAESGGEGEGAADAATATVEGESEGTSAEDDEVVLLTGLAFMEGHIRAGLALYEQGDLAAAKTHMGHPIEEKYEAVEDQLERSGHGVLEEQIRALAAATEAEADLAEVEALFADVRETMEAVRADYPADKQVAGLVELTRIAGAEYAAAVADDGSVADLHEYQDSWGFLRVVENEATQMAESGDDETLAAVARAMLKQIDVTGEVYGDLQGEGTFETDPAVIYGAAARMELAGLKLERSVSEGEGEGEGEGEASREGEGESDVSAAFEGEGESD